MNITGKLIHISPSSAAFSDILKMDLVLFPRPWSRADWLEIDWDHHKLMAWMLNDRVLAFALWGRVPLDETAHLLKICVETGVRGSGVSHDFWQNSVDWLKLQGVKSLYLEVESHNLRAINFYQKCGLKTLRVIKSYYSDGADAQTMQMTV